VRYVAQRLLLLIPTLFGIMVLVFLMLHLAPGDPVEMLVEGTSALAPQQLLDLIRSDLGLDRPLHEQFLRYVGRVLRGDLGMSYRTKMPITLDIQHNVGSTILLAAAGIVVALLIGAPAGIISALRRNTAADYATLTVAMVGLAAPSFWIGILFLYIFGYRLAWFPIIGGGRGGWLSSVHHLILPAIVIGLGLAALIARLTRSSTLEVLGQDYVRTARAKGLAGTFIVLKHVLRNAAIPVVAAAGTMFAYLLTGAVVVEIVFSRRGLGQLMVAAINGRDFPLVQGLILVFGVIIVLVNLATDLLLATLDPRVSYQ
jgi:peptide/nickel transport system permease protein/oligopeptide transport system permease protein